MNTRNVPSTLNKTHRARPVGAANRSLDQYAHITLVAVVTLLLTFVLQTAVAATAPPLGTAAGFAVLAATPDVNNTGPTVITGDLGVSPAAAVVGFPPGNVIGTMHAGDATAAGAQVDNAAAYAALAAQACNMTFAGPTDLAGMTLVPGVYCFASSASNSGLLKLDAGGNSAAVWIFRTVSTLITGSASTVQTINGGQNCNVFWQVGSSATLGTAATFVGNILALTSITLQTGATLSGRALAQTGTVTLAGNTISVCSLLPPLVSIAPTVSIAYGPASVSAGAASLLTLTFFNANPVAAALSAAHVYPLPAGLAFAPNPNASTTCTGAGVMSALAGGTSLGIGFGYSIPAAGSCTVTVAVLATLPGSYVSVVPAGWLQTSLGSNANPANATLTAIAAVPAVLPSLAKSFSPANVTQGAVTTLTITLSNANVTIATLGAALTDNLPGGMVVASAPNASTTCGGIVVAAAGSNTVTLPAGSTIPVNGNCVIVVNVMALGAGSLLNTLPVGALQTNNGNNSTSAVATLNVSSTAVVPTLSASYTAMLAVILLIMGIVSTRRASHGCL